MKIHVNEHGAVTSITDAQFVANASFANNVIDTVFDLPGLSDECYCLVGIIRPDGKVINDLQALLTIEEDGERVFRYSILNGDGVLYCKGALQVSVQLIEDGQVLSSATVTAHVFHNIGKQTQEEYDAFRALLDETGGELSKKLNANTLAVDNIENRMDEVEIGFEEVKADIDADIEGIRAVVNETENKVNKNISDMEVLQDWVIKERLVDFTVDHETGVGVKYFDNGKTATVQYPINSAENSVGSGFVTELTFTAESFVSGECAFTKEQTGFNSDKFIATVEIRERGKYKQLAASVFKGTDGSLLLSYNEAFNGRVLLCGAGNLLKGDTGTLIFLADIITALGEDITVGEEELLNLDIMPRKPQISDLIVTKSKDEDDKFPSGLYRITKITENIYDCAWLTEWSGYKGERGGSWFFTDKEITSYGNLDESPGITHLSLKDIFQYRTDGNSLGEPKVHDMVLSRGNSNYGVVILSDGINVNVQHLGSIKGDRGAPFSVAATYSSVKKMEADFNNEAIALGAFVAIDTGNIEDEDNAKLYWKGETEFKYLLDLSGSTGLTGPSAYDVAVNNGYNGSESEWLTSLKGDKGEQGDKGDRGARGLTGSKGDSAYTVAVNNGYNGSESEWLASLKGDKGDKGDRGEQGDKGDKGDRGDKGEKGDKGERGDKGINPIIEIDGVTMVSPYEAASIDNVGDRETMYLHFTIPRGYRGEQGVQGEPGSIENLPTGQNGKVLINDNGKVGYLDASSILGENFGGSEPTPVISGQSLTNLYLNKTACIEAMSTAAKVFSMTEEGDIVGGVSLIVTATVNGTELIWQPTVLNLVELFDMGMIGAPRDGNGNDIILSGFALADLSDMRVFYSSQPYRNLISFDDNGESVFEETETPAGFSEFVEEDGRLIGGAGYFPDVVPDIEQQAIAGTVTNLVYNGVALETFNNIFSSTPNEDKSLKEYIDEANSDLKSYVDTAKSELNVSLNKKVDKVTGKGLSTNDFGIYEKERLYALIASQLYTYSHMKSIEPGNSFVFSMQGTWIIALGDGTGYLDFTWAGGATFYYVGISNNALSAKTATTLSFSDGDILHAFIGASGQGGFRKETNKFAALPACCGAYGATNSNAKLTFTNNSSTTVNLRMYGYDVR